MVESTAIVGVGNIRGTLARRLVAGGESVLLAARNESHAKALANELGPLAHADYWNTRSPAPMRSASPCGSTRSRN
jgi:predicted dinucleotide-binding enzyme